MRNSRFLELLNLYVDQQLANDEAHELECEIKSNPQRAKMYQQYCRMQKACALLFENERSLAPATGVLSNSLVAADRKIIAYPRREPKVLRFVSFAALGFAAAASVAFVVLNRPRHTMPSSALTVTTLQGTEPVATVVTVPSIAAHTPRATDIRNADKSRPEYFSVFAPRSNFQPEIAGDLVVDDAEANRVSYEWMHAVRLSPVAPLSERITWTAAESNQPSATREVRLASHAQESAAFQFQR